MIIGVGLDSIEIDRISNLLIKFPQRFKNRIFTLYEQNYARRVASPAASFAKRFAAKEACLKAMGTGRSQKIAWRDIEITHTLLGQPTIVLHNNALFYMKKKFGETDLQFNVSLSDTRTLAQAIVIISQEHSS